MGRGARTDAALLAFFVAMLLLLAGAMASDVDPLDFSAPSLKESVAPTPAASIEGAQELRRVTTKEILSKLWDEDMDQETRHNFEQLASNLTEMNPAYVQLVVDGVNGTESSSKSERSSAANRYLVTWPPPGYTGPISLWITQSDLPTARPVEPWIVKNGYKPYSSANVTKTTAQGGFKVIIEHAPLPDVTSEQIKWFFTNLGGHTKWDGEYVRNYLLMHPRDHIQSYYTAVNSEGLPGTGSYIRFQEVLMSEKPEGYIQSDSPATIALVSLTQAYIDMNLLVGDGDNSIKFEIVVPLINLPIFTLEWKWTPRSSGGLDWTSTFTFIPYVFIIPQFIYEFVLTAYHQLNDKFWIHTVEEIANLNEIVPKIYPKSG